MNSQFEVVHAGAEVMNAHGEMSHAGGEVVKY